MTRFTILGLVAATGLAACEGAMPASTAGNPVAIPTDCTVPDAVRASNAGMSPGELLADLPAGMRAVDRDILANVAAGTGSVAEVSYASDCLGVSDATDFQNG